MPSLCRMCIQTCWYIFRCFLSTPIGTAVKISLRVGAHYRFILPISRLAFQIIVQNWDEQRQNWKALQCLACLCTKSHYQSSDRNMSEEREVLGCAHYKRHCRLVAPCCAKVYNCRFSDRKFADRSIFTILRFCHDEAEPTHSLDRKKVEEVECLKCKARYRVQSWSRFNSSKENELALNSKITLYRSPAEADCKQCGVVFGSAYFCRICRLIPSSAY